MKTCHVVGLEGSSLSFFDGLMNAWIATSNGTRPSNCVRQACEDELPPALRASVVASQAAKPRGVGVGLSALPFTPAPGWWLTWDEPSGLPGWGAFLRAALPRRILPVYWAYHAFSFLVGPVLIYLDLPIGLWASPYKPIVRDAQNPPHQWWCLLA